MKPHEANQHFWDRSVDWWREWEDDRGEWQRALAEPELVLPLSVIQRVGSLRGTHVAVLGSGDNAVAFAFAGLGADVTSVDISEARLQVARERAKKLGVKQRFVRADLSDLSEIEDGSVGLVYLGGHVTIWLSDLAEPFAEVLRVLAEGGSFVVDEFHPVRRMFQDNTGEQIINDYLARGPYEYGECEERTYEYHWSVADHLAAALEVGLAISYIEETRHTSFDLPETTAVHARTPNRLTFIAEKR
jgi:ubiquinone/menaquinone biosynthesis C-methylase UbiE